MNEQIPTPTESLIRTWLTDRIAALTGLSGDRIDPDRPLQDAGLSSRDLLSLTAELGEVLGRPLAATVMWQYPSIAALATALTAAETGLPASAPAGVTAMTGDEPIAVIGVGCRLPGGVESPAQFWRLLDSGIDAIREVPPGRWESFAPADVLATLPRSGGFLDDIAGFDAAHFGITPREAEAIDPQQRMLLEVTWAALEHAGVPPCSLRGSRTGVFVGLSASEYGLLTMSDVQRVDAWSGTGAAASIAANRLSYLLDLRGPSLTLDTACSSSLVAVHQAVASLRRGESDAALVAGVNVLLSPGPTATFERAGVLAADGRCKPFDAGADGIARGEGCGVVVLKPLRAARAAGDRVLAVIRGSSVNSDGRSNGMMAPNPQAQADLLREAYASAGVDPASVDYVEAHGTGTLLGDPIEATALGTVLGAHREPGRPLLIGSVKSNLGHLEGAAGIAGLIKVVLAMVHRRLPASLHYHAPNPHIDFTGLGLRVVPAAGAPWPRYPGTARAGVSAFGFGGTNAHVVLEEWPAASFPPRVATAEQTRIFALSTGSPEVLRARAAELADWIESPAGQETPLEVIASTLATRREHLPVRGTVVTGNRHRLVEGLRELSQGRGARDVAEGTVRASTDVVFVFSGYGSQWPEMGRRLLRTEPAFRAVIDELEPAFHAEAGFSLREVLSGTEPADLGATQLVLFGMQIALAGLWRAHEVAPAAVLGHSMGEVAAAVVAGALDVAGGLRVMAARARLLAEVDAGGDGAMAVVELSPAELAELEAEYPGITVAVYASPTQCTVSGSAGEVEDLLRHVERLGRLARRLPVRGAGHSPAVEAGLGQFRAELAGLRPEQADIPCYSSVLDDPREPAAFDVDYWAANLRRPVRFTHALAAAAEDGHTIFVEISPHPVALAAIEQTTGGRAIGLPSGSRTIDERASFLTSLARLHVLGRLGVLAASAPRTPPVGLPGPVWRHERFWPRPLAVRRANGAHPLLGTHLEVPGGGSHLWRADLGTTEHPWLTDHAAMGVPVFPATGFLELALAAARTVFPGTATAITVDDLELHRVLPLTAHTEVTTSLMMSPGAPAELSVHGKGADGTWFRYATARVHAGQAATPVSPAGPVIPLNPVHPDAGGAGEIDIYRLLARVGQDYGPAFRGLRRVVAAPGRASAEVRLPEQAIDHPAYLLHPAQADACLHTLAASTGAALDSSEGIYLPLTVGRIELSADPRRGVRVHAMLDSLDESGDGLLGTVRLVDQDGAALVTFRNVYCRRFRRSALPIPPAGLVYESVWQRADRPVAGAGTGERHRWAVLLDGDREEDGARLAALRAAAVDAGVEVHVAALGDSEALEALAVLSGRPLTAVIVLTGRAARRNVPDPGRAARQVLAVSELVARLVDAPAPTPRLWLVSAGAVAVAPGEAGQPGLAAWHGLVRVLAFEHPELRASHVDLDAGPDPARLRISELLEEIAADGPDDEVAWRDGNRYLRRLARPELPVAPGTPVVRAGAYVITGGLGGLGLVAARWLAERGASRLVLSGRRGADPATEPALIALRELGAEVLVVPADIAEEGTAARLVELATADRMPLRGVLHAAGVLADGAASTLDRATLEKVWRPKAIGAWRLHQATEGLDLDWWLVYSSAASLFGSPGQAAYASANGWADALVTWRRGRGLPAATVHWGAWGEVGAVTGTRNPVLDPLGTDEALGMLDLVLGSGREATGVARLDTATVLTLFPRLAERPYFALFTADRDTGNTVNTLSTMDTLDTAGPSWAGMDVLRHGDPALARNTIADHLAVLIAGLMGFAADEVDRHVPLTQLGLDSLMAMRARGVVERDFGLPLPVPLLLRGASLAEVADHLADQAGFTPAPELAIEVRPVVLGPRDPAERWVARHWRAVLGGPDPGVHDDFFAVGGSAEDAERLRAAFAVELTTVPDTAALFATPTVAGIADLVRAEVEGGTGGPVRKLREGNGSTPVFLFHPAGGPTSVYRELVRLLPAGAPVYGLERIDEEETVEGKAACYAELVREIQPHGPYLLGGWSLGGCLAYETAQCLAAAGERIGLVFLIDSILPLPTERRRAGELLLDRFDRFAEYIEETYGVALEISREELGTLDEREQIDAVMARLAARVPEMGQGVLHHQYTSYVDARVAERYRPRPYDGKVLLLRAQEPHPLTTTLDPRYLRTDDALGWTEYSTGLEVVRVPGDHLSMIDPPHVSTLASELGDRLRSSVGGAGRGVTL